MVLEVKQKRRLLTLLPSMNKLNTFTHVQVHLREGHKQAERLVYTGQLRKHPHSNERKAEAHLAINPALDNVVYN
jgi:hypothetical protein